MTSGLSAGNQSMDRKPCETFLLLFRMLLCCLGVIMLRCYNYEVQMGFASNAVLLFKCVNPFRAIFNCSGKRYLLQFFMDSFITLHTESMTKVAKTNEEIFLNF